MTYNLNIDQQFAIEHGLTLTQVSTLAAFMTLPIWSNTMAIDGVVWYQYSEEKMAEDFPLLFGVPKRCYKNISELCGIGYVQLTKMGHAKYVRFTERCANWNKEITISNKPGNFVYTVRDSLGNALYVGGTSNIDRKAFNFPFEYATITGYYYDFPDFEDEIDARICELTPKYNLRLHSYRTKAQAMKDAQTAFHKFGLPFRKPEKDLVGSYLANELTSTEFRGDVYYCKMDVEEMIISLLEDYGKNYFESSAL